MGSKAYHKKKNKEWYELDKKIKKEYRESMIYGKTYTEFKRERKKVLGK